VTLEQEIHFVPDALLLAYYDAYNSAEPMVKQYEASPPFFSAICDQLGRDWCYAERFHAMAAKQLGKRYGKRLVVGLWSLTSNTAFTRLEDLMKYERTALAKWIENETEYDRAVDAGGDEKRRCVTFMDGVAAVVKALEAIEKEYVRLVRVARVVEKLHARGAPTPGVY